MAYYKYAEFLRQQHGPEYDAEYRPGDKAPFSGIYYCKVCKESAVSTVGHTLPPHEHVNYNTLASALYPATWRLAVKAHLQ